MYPAWKEVPSASPSMIGPVSALWPHIVMATFAVQPADSESLVITHNCHLPPVIRNGKPTSHAKSFLNNWLLQGYLSVKIRRNNKKNINYFLDISRVKYYRDLQY